WASLRRTAANSPRLPCSPVSRLRTFAAMFPVLMPRSSSSSRTGEVDGAVPCRDERPAVRRAWAVRSFGVLQPHPVGPLDVLVEAAVEVVDLRVGGVSVVGAHDLLDTGADDRVGRLLPRHLLELPEHPVTGPEVRVVPLRRRDQHV